MAVGGNDVLIFRADNNFHCVVVMIGIAFGLGIIPDAQMGFGNIVNILPGAAYRALFEMRNGLLIIEGGGKVFSYFTLFTPVYSRVR